MRNAITFVIPGEIVPYTRVGRERWTDRARRYLASRDADGAAYLARKITPAMDMMTALSDELDDARQTIGVQRAALDGAATTVERYEADLAEACALLSSAMRTAPSAFSYGWIRSAHALLERNAGLIEAHRAPADWRRGGAQ